MLRCGAFGRRRPSTRLNVVSDEAVCGWKVSVGSMRRVRSTYWWAVIISATAGGTAARSLMFIPAAGSSRSGGAGAAVGITGVDPSAAEAEVSGCAGRTVRHIGWAGRGVGVGVAAGASDVDGMDAGSAAATAAWTMLLTSSCSPAVGSMDAAALPVEAGVAVGARRRRADWVAAAAGGALSATAARRPREADAEPAEASAAAVGGLVAATDEAASLAPARAVAAARLVAARRRPGEPAEREGRAVARPRGALERGIAPT